MPCTATTQPATDAAAELAELIAAAHDRDLEVWIDVVYNHTTEIHAGGPTYNLRGLADADYYRLAPDGSYLETTGCGNDIDASSAAAQDLIVMSLDRYADLGADGFRFDLAAVLSRHRPLIARLDDMGGDDAASRWSPSRGTPPARTSWGGHGPAAAGCSGTIATATTSVASSVAKAVSSPP